MKLACLLVVVAVSAAPPVARADTSQPIVFKTEDGSINFTMPSNNVECTYFPAHFRGTYRTNDDLAEIDCDRAEPSYVRLIMGEESGPTLIKNPGDQPCCSDNNTFDYDHTWTAEPFTCDSHRDGLMCKRSDGHGFRISRAKAEVF